MQTSGNQFGGTNVSQKFLDAIDACSLFLPHTCDAAKKARQKAEMLQHHYGIGSVFLTCNFDDKNSLIMQVLKGGNMIDDDSDVSQLTDKELRKCQDKCKLLCIEFPGLCAH
jgi:hypothetical protein